MDTSVRLTSWRFDSIIYTYTKQEHTMNPGPGFIRFVFGLVLTMSAVGASDEASISSILFYAFFGLVFLASGVKAMNAARN